AARDGRGGGTRRARGGGPPTGGPPGAPARAPAPRHERAGRRRPRRDPPETPHAVLPPAQAVGAGNLLPYDLIGTVVAGSHTRKKASAGLTRMVYSTLRNLGGSA